MPGQATTWRHVSGYRLLLRRIECALLHTDIRTANDALRMHKASLAAGCVLATIAVAAYAFVCFLRPQAGLGHARIVIGQESGALYVRVGDIWHPVLNLASARLIAVTDANPQPVRESEIRRTKRGPLLGIPGAPAVLAPTLAGDESIWTVCDTDSGAATTVVIGPVTGSPVRHLAGEQTLLVAPTSGSPAYLLYNGRRAMVDLADPVISRALRLEGRVPRVVSQLLLDAVPEAPPITTPSIRGMGGRGPAALPGYPVGSVLRVARAQGDEYYVVLGAGVQRIGQVVADLLRFSDSHGAASVVSVAPDVVGSVPIVDTLPVSTYPERAPKLWDRIPEKPDTTMCVTWFLAQTGSVDTGFLVGETPPVPVGQMSVTLAQADGHGPALDAVYLPPGRSAYVVARRLSGAGTRSDPRYLVTDTGVRFGIHDDAAHDLGLPATVIPAPWPVLAKLPAGPELSRAKALVARDTVVAGMRRLAS
ncbi:type VII secretion protein EccB [Mycobacterium sp.]|uniref:type VII secretion protein EccB n=1 Tax=Mycobacterium sp. TaxID=1785 RepID=UPI003BAD7CA8